jgi:hypothetical protein
VRIALRINQVASNVARIRANAWLAGPDLTRSIDKPGLNVTALLNEPDIESVAHFPGRDMDGLPIALLLRNRIPAVTDAVDRHGLCVCGYHPFQAVVSLVLNYIPEHKL